MTRSSGLLSRYKALLKVNELARSGATIEETFRSMCLVLRNILPFDLVTLALYDANQDALRIEAAYGPRKSGIFHPGYLFSRDSGLSGWTFQHQTASVSRDLREESRFPAQKQIVDEGYRSLCSVPLIVAGKSIGVVIVFGTRKKQFSARDAELMQELSNQITMTILSNTRRCPIHPDTKLLCPRCLGSAGGRSTVKKYREDLSRWGQKGGRGHKKAGTS